MRLQLNTSELQPSETMVHFTQHIFDLISDDLGLTYKPGIVDVKFLKRTHNNAEGACNVAETDPYRIEVKATSPRDILITLAHEMIHVRDLVRGHLTINLDQMILHYQGQVLHASDVRLVQKAGFYDWALAHEFEAHNKMYPLALRVFNRLSQSAKDYVIKWSKEDPIEFIKDRLNERKRGLETLQGLAKDKRAEKELPAHIMKGRVE